jgi:rare lipoprotein A (peptidoglycan hydrolase)
MNTRKGKRKSAKAGGSRPSRSAGKRPTRKTVRRGATPRRPKATKKSKAVIKRAKAAKKITKGAVPPQKILFQVAGRMSTFGGPDDSGMRADEGLKLFDQTDLEDQKFAYLFLPAQPAGTSGLGRRLNPNSYYVACRWDEVVTPRELLRNSLVRVENLQTGRAAEARPVDWRPDLSGGRVADLSPGLAAALGLKTDGLVRVTLTAGRIIPVAPPVPPPKPTPAPVVKPTILGIVQGVAIEARINASGSETVHFVADADIDCDGSGGNPDHDPYFQPDTTLHGPDGRALNAYQVPFVVVPPLVCQKTRGMVLGSECLVTHTLTKRQVLCVVGDLGPTSKIGELSVAAARAIGVPSNPVTGGQSRKVIDYEIRVGKPAVISGVRYTLKPCPS